MARLLYTLLLYCLTPLILLKLWFRGRKSPEYRQRWGERFGLIPDFTSSHAVSPLWIHSVSLGETVAITPLVEQLLAQYPEQPIIMTTMTPTGSERVRAQFGDRVMHVYCPYDLPDVLARFHNRVKPRCCIIVETELWPNLIRSCASRDVPVLVANARLSARSAKGYQRFAWLTRPMLRDISCIAAQNPVDGQRFLDLGLSTAQLAVTGSIKFDITPPQGDEEEIKQLRSAWGIDRPVFIAASTHDDEEQQLIGLYKALQNRSPELLLILVPRHPERFVEVYNQCLRAGLKTSRRSLREPPATDINVYLGDTMGDMMKLYAAADIAFVGGSLIERGGHNPLEPAVLGKPVLMGPHLFNFQQIADQLEKQQALTVVSDIEQLQLVVRQLLDNPEQVKMMGAAGQAYMDANRGALVRLSQLVQKYSQPS
ncbi:lipid IV(A) 3-deoxy-D-manno-octulosonic acid transferase [Amphritea sp. HPY]|uniref:lipid IV(A) 3-deoxy-D-manno-octulosonic acid transferase n=1 Tax=Amphritea sp. HPY TaxID=3421652 RepID=UPI003D7E4A79